MHDRSLLVKFVEDLGKYCLRERTKFSEKPLSVFAPVFNFSPAAARTFALDFFGPCDSQVRLLSKWSVAVNFASCCNYYKSCKYKGPFEIAMDATAATAVVRMDLKHTIHWDGQVNFICFIDPKHLLKRSWNPMLTPSRTMVIGDHPVHFDDVRLTFKHLKLKCV